MTVLPPITSLMSPPETKPLDSFTLTPAKTPSTVAHTAHNQYTPESIHENMPNAITPDQKLRILPSPPISPWMHKQSTAGQEALQTGKVGDSQASYTKDPVLFDSGSFDENQPPLFPPVEIVKSTDDLIDQHMAMHMVQFKNKLNRPTREEYRLAISCVPRRTVQQGSCGVLEASP